MQPYRSYHTTVNYRDYRPASQAPPRSLICLSPRSVLISVWSINLTLTTHNNAILTKSVLTLNANKYYEYRLALQAVPRSSIRRSTSTIFSMARRSSGAVAWTATLILTRLAWQALVSVVYVSCHYQSA